MAGPWPAQIEVNAAQKGEKGRRCCITRRKWRRPPTATHAGSSRQGQHGPRCQGEAVACPGAGGGGGSRGGGRLGQTLSAPFTYTGQMSRLIRPTGRAEPPGANGPGRVSTGRVNRLGQAEPPSFPLESYNKALKTLSIYILDYSVLHIYI